MWKDRQLPTLIAAIGAASAVVCLTSFGAFAGIANANARPAGRSPEWSVVPSPNAPLRSNELNGVSCPSANSCFAVGQIDSIGLVQHWNGRAWSVMQVPHPNGATSSNLYGVSCPSLHSCFAVGDLVEHWNGAHWAIMVTPTPSAVSVLNGVACPSVKSCFAVGYYAGTPATKRTLIEHWNGTQWSIMAGADPSHALASLFSLSAVACPNVRSCFAVGDTAETRVLIEHWNGTNWGLMGTPQPGRPASTHLSGVACPSAKSCFAVGDAASHALVEHWNGSNWGIMTGSAAPTLWRGVSCPSTKSCFAVGTAVRIVGHWNGKTWGTMPVAVGSTNIDLFDLKGVFCPAGSSCFAVGNYNAHARRRKRWSRDTCSDPRSRLPERGCVEFAHRVAGNPYFETSVFMVNVEARTEPAAITNEEVGRAENLAHLAEVPIVPHCGLRSGKVGRIDIEAAPDLPEDVFPRDVFALFEECVAQGHAQGRAGRVVDCIARRDQPERRNRREGKESGIESGEEIGRHARAQGIDLSDQQLRSEWSAVDPFERPGMHV